jgi:hypothetical protein
MPRAGACTARRCTRCRRASCARSRRAGRGGAGAPERVTALLGAGGLDAAQAETGLRLGQRVQHPKFGEGIVLNAEGQGNGARVQINFEAVGAKWLVVAYANLTPV